MYLSKLERETNITFNESELTATIEVHNPKLKRKLAALNKQQPDEVMLQRQDEFADFYTIPKSWIRISPKRRRNFTEEQKAALRERAKTHFSKNSTVN